MVRRDILKPNKSFCENSRLIVPNLFDDFISNMERIVSHPRLKNEFHIMRIAGKTLRYAMENFSIAFQDDFSSCLEEVKQVLDVMGTIHDCDVNIPKIQMHLKEIRLFNGMMPSAKDKIRTKALVNLIAEQRKLRSESFNNFCIIIKQWNGNNFRQRILDSMMKNTPLKSNQKISTLNNILQ